MSESSPDLEEDPDSSEESFSSFIRLRFFFFLLKGGIRTV